MSNVNIINHEKLREKIVKFARRAGRISARPVLLLYYVMKSPETPKSDKILIFSTISYLVLPIDLISAKRLPIIGWIDEMVSFTVAYQKVSKHITPQIEVTVDNLMDKWFPEYTKYELVP